MNIAYRVDQPKLVRGANHLTLQHFATPKAQKSKTDNNSEGEDTTHGNHRNQ